MKKPNLKNTVIGLSIVLVSLFTIRTVYDWTREKKPESDYGAPYPEVATIKPEMFFDLGKASEAGNRFKDAQEFYQIGLRYFPQNVELWISLARVEEILGNKAEAIKALEQAAKLSPENPKLYTQLAKLYFQLNKFSQAYDALKKAVTLEPDNTRYLYMLAQLANLNKKYAESLEIYRQLLESHPSNTDLVFAIEKIKSWAKETSVTDHAEILLNEALASFEKGNDEQAYDYLNQYAILFGKTEQYQLLIAEQIYLDMVENNPRDSESFFRLAQFYYRYNQPEKALDAINQALAIQKNMEYLQLSVLIAKQLDLPEEQKRAYEAMLMITPKDREIYHKLVILDLAQKVNITEKQFEESPLLMKIAIEEFEGNTPGALIALEKYGKEEYYNPLYQTMLSFLAYKIDRCTFATYCNPDSLTLLANSFIKNSSQRIDDSRMLQDKAEIISRKLTCMAPCSPQVLDLYATSLRIHEDPPFVDFLAAQRTYSKILQIEPCNPAAFRNLARVTALMGETDRAASLYNKYVHAFCPDKDVLIEFSGLLEDQGNIGLALHYLNICEEYYGSDDYTRGRRAHILNSGELSTPAICIAQEMLEEDPCSYIGWLNYTNAAAILNYPYRSLYGLDTLETLNPGNPQTKGARWTVWPPLLSTATLYGEFYQETTSLTEYFERLEGAYSVRPDLKITAGTEHFQAYASTTFNLVLGLGNLRGINGEAWGSEYSAWIGANKILNPKLIANVRVGGAHQSVGNIHSSTPTYLVNLFMPLCDNLDIDFLSSYGFLLISPRSLSLKIRKWTNFLTIDWRPCWGYQLLSTFDGRLNTDGNKQLETYIYPRKTVYYRRNWKIDLGLMGTWLASHKSRETGYYQPHLYQGYAGQVLADFRIDDLNVIQFEGSLGCQKDTFSTRFGFLGDVQCRALFNISMNWYLNVSGEYYYIDTSEGPFSFIDFAGGLTHRF